VDRTPPSILARVLRGEAGALAGLMRESLEAVVGRPVQLEVLPADHPVLSRLFGGRDLFVFPFVDGDGGPLPMFLALDRPAAVATASAFSLMNPGRVSEALASAEVPEVLRDALCGVAGIIAGTARRIVRSRAPAGTEFFRCGHDVRRITPGAWPALVGEIDHGVPWNVLGLRLTIEGTEAGALLLGSSDRWEGPIGPGSGEDADTAEVPAENLAIGGGGRAEPVGAPPPFQLKDARTGPVPRIPRVIEVQVIGNPLDRAVAALRATLAEAGCELLPADPARGAGLQPSVVFVVSRAPIDLRSRLESAIARHRAALIVACSDLPTIDMVRAARAGTADTFLVLPADRARLHHLLQRFAEVLVP